MPKLITVKELNQTFGDYLKTIYDLSLDMSPVSTSAIAKRLEVSNASVSDMLRKLHRKNFITHVPYKGASLTSSGRREALRLLRRHRLWELFLIDFMKMPWSLVHTHAERLEHVTDDMLEDRLAQLLGQPKIDPHGDPIPSKNGEIHELPRRRLSEMKSGENAVFRQCINESPEMLGYLKKLEFTPGVRFKLVEILPFDGSYVLRIGKKIIHISPTVAEMVIITPSNSKQKQ